MSRLLLAGSVIIAGLALAGCASGSGLDGGRIDYVRVDGGYHQSDFAYGASGRDLATDMIGNPFPNVGQAEFGQAVTDAMQGSHFGPRTHFATAPDDSARPAYRVRMLWNGAPSINGQELCDGTPLEGGTGAGGEEIRLIAAFCRGDRAQTYVVGSVDEVSSPDDPRFRTFVRHVTSRLFPPADRFDDPDRCLVPGC